MIRHIDWHHDRAEPDQASTGPLESNDNSIVDATSETVVSTGPAEDADPLSDALEIYIELADAGVPPDPEEFAARFPAVREDLMAALEGLSLVRGLVGSSVSGPSQGRLEAGRRVAGYRIVRELGRGGMGVVYDAVQVGLDRPVALKVLGTHAAPDSTSRRRFLNEARTAAHLHHTHIVPVFEVGQIGGLCYYAMQRIDGSGLDQVIKAMRKGRSTPSGLNSGSSLKSSKTRVRHDPLAVGMDDTITWSKAAVADRSERDLQSPTTPYEPPRGGAYFRWVAEVGRDASDALNHAHEQGVIHRDVKPSNLLVDLRGSPWVADFGLARKLADPSFTLREDVIGTPKYMSPEQAEGEQVDCRSDVYSLGATLYELLTLRPPFDGTTTAELSRQIRTREPVAPRKLEPRAPRDLETIVLKAIAKRPADRYATAGELRDDLVRFLMHEPVRARRISPVGRLWRFAQRHPGISIVTTTAALVVLSVATLAYFRVLTERDRAIRANGKLLLANGKLILSELSSLRYSTAPNRREHGASLIKDALAMGFGDEYKAQLRDEALAYLGIRDVVNRSSLATGRIRGLLYLNTGPRGPRRLATLSLAGDELAIWDPDQRRILVNHSLVTTSDDENPADNRAGKPAPPPGMSRRIAVMRDRVAAVQTDGRAVLFFDATSGNLVGKLASPKHRILAIQAAVFGRRARLVTVEHDEFRAQSTPRGGVAGERPADPGIATTKDSKAQSSTVYQDPDLDMMQETVSVSIRLWDPLKPDEPIATLDAWEEPAGGQMGEPQLPLVAIDPEGERIATARLFGEDVMLWTAREGKPWTDPDGHPRPKLASQTRISSLAFGPSGVLAAAGGGLIRLWDIDTNLSLSTIRSNEGTIRLLRFSPGGSMLAAAGMSNDFEIWDPADQSAPVARFSTSDWVDDIAFSWGGRSLAVAGSDGVCQFLDINDPVGRIKISGVNATPCGIAFRDDGKLIAVGSWMGMVQFWTLGSGPRKNFAWKLADDGKLRNEPIGGFRQSGRRGPISRRESEPTNSSTGHAYPITPVFDARDQLVTITPRSFGKFPSQKGGPKLPELGRGVMTERPIPSQARNQFALVPVARTPVGRTIVGISGRELLLFHPESKECFKRIPLPIPPIQTPTPDEARDHSAAAGPEPSPNPFWWNLAIAPDGSRVYAHSLYANKSELMVFDLRQNAARLVEWKGIREITCLALTSDGRLLAVGDRQGGVTLVDASTGEMISKLVAPKEDGERSISALGFSPTGKLLAVGSPEHVRLWALDWTEHAAAKTAKPAVLTKPLAKLPGHRANVLSLVFSKQGDQLASGGSDEELLIWDLKKIHEGLRKLGLDWNP